VPTTSPDQRGDTLRVAGAIKRPADARSIATRHANANLTVQDYIAEALSPPTRDDLARVFDLGRHSFVMWGSVLQQLPRATAALPSRSHVGQEELASILYYTFAGYEVMNSWFPQDRHVRNLAASLPFVRAANSGLRKLQAAGGIYRGEAVRFFNEMPSSILEDLSKGRAIVQSGFTSASKWTPNTRVGADLPPHGGFQRPAQLPQDIELETILVSRTGIDISRISQQPGEGEILFMTGTSFRARDLRQLDAEGKRWFARLEEIDSP
jgi:hypothetical protein